MMPFRKTTSPLTCDFEFRNLVLGALLTGCRDGELARMQTGDFSPEAGAITMQLQGKAIRHARVSKKSRGPRIQALSVGRPCMDREAEW